MAAFQILASGARTATTTSPAGSTFPGKPSNSKAFLLLINVTSITATPSVTPKMRARDASGTGFVVWDATTPLSAVGVYGYWFRWGTSMPAQVVDGDIIEVLDRAIPDDWDVLMTHGDADSITYEVGGQWFGFAD